MDNDCIQTCEAIRSQLFDEIETLQKETQEFLMRDARDYTKLHEKNMALEDDIKMWKIQYENDKAEKIRLLKENEELRKPQIYGYMCSTSDICENI